MSQESKPGKKVERKELVPSLTVAETISYLEEHGVKPMGEEWKSGEPFLYIFEEGTRTDNGPFATTSIDKRPSLARINGPTNIVFDKPIVSIDTPGAMGYRMTNPGGQIDYYAIDGETKRPVYVRTSFRDTTDGIARYYFVLKEHLYEANDALFPRQDVQKPDPTAK
jgi:hypothetical protein